MGKYPKWTLQQIPKDSNKHRRWVSFYLQVEYIFSVLHQNAENNIWSPKPGRSLVVLSKENILSSPSGECRETEIASYSPLHKQQQQQHRHAHKNQTNSKCTTTSLYPLKELTNDGCPQRDDVRTLSHLGQMQLDTGRRTLVKLLTNQ